MGLEKISHLTKSGTWWLLLGYGNNSDSRTCLWKKFYTKKTDVDIEYQLNVGDPYGNAVSPGTDDKKPIEIKSRMIKLHEGILRNDSTIIDNLNQYRSELTSSFIRMWVKKEP